MDDNFEKKSIDGEIVSDSTDTYNKGDGENA